MLAIVMDHDVKTLSMIGYMFMRNWRFGIEQVTEEAWEDEP